ncbi:Serine/threonine-protein kinase PknB [Rubripirellula tenax]|uniref:non-specific serine/threonine protein kinase n=1 Tax=Rubripirellula tenax TaxID=2528015 RepID=A0A5C6F9K4_9BACT|nr:WD40 repeat domain-containing serine/threonine protein kinase [Rubripirellula tenax]TWU56836.1 Serine/threonine-protein kinase PknB [Rubripirellula tenax]
MSRILSGVASNTDDDEVVGLLDPPSQKLFGQLREFAKRLQTVGEAPPVVDGFNVDRFLQNLKKADPAVEPTLMAGNDETDGSAFSSSIVSLSAQTDFLQPPEAEDEIGRLGGYRILEVLGVGGMGIVFKAEDTQLKRLVALKAIKPAIASNSIAKQRFLREAQSTASIEHHNIVPIYQVGEDGGVPFIAMQFLHGESLQSHLQHHPKLDQTEVLKIGREVAAGLQAAHEHGLIHRDIKPDNIWLDAKSGWARILDFGLVRAASDDLLLTQTDAIVGTPRYMAPEQAQGQAVDHRSDLFSLGSVLYQLATGVPSFTGGNMVATLLAVVNAESKPIAEIAPEIHPDLAALITRLLSKDPQARPQAAAEVVAEITRIERLIQTEPTALAAGSSSATAQSIMPEAGAYGSQTSSGSNGTQIRNWLLAGGFAAFFILAAILLRFKTNDGTVVVQLDGPIELATIEIDDQSVTYQSDETGQIRFRVAPGTHRFTLKNSAGLELETTLGDSPLEIKTGATTSLKAWLERKPDPSGAVVSSAKEKKAAALPTKIPTGPLPKLGTWEPTTEADVDDWYWLSHSLAEMESLPGLALRPAKLKGIRRWNVDTRLPRAGCGSVKFSPDGRHFAVLTNDCQVRIYDAKNLELIQMLPSRGGGSFRPMLDWHSSGRHLVVANPNASATTLWTLVGESLQPTIPIALDQCNAAGFSSDGKILATATAGLVCLYQVDGKILHTVVHPDLNPFAQGKIVWSPDGQIFASQNEDGSLWLFDREGELIRKIDAQTVGAKAGEGAIHWSPSGEFLCAIDGDTQVSIRCITPDGKRQKTVQVARGGRLTQFCWSPDGKRIYAIGHSIWSVTDVDSGEIHDLPQNPGATDIDVSPDGEWVVAIPDRSFHLTDRDLNPKENSETFTGSFGLVRWDASGERLVVGELQPTLWTLDGRHSPIDGVENLWSYHAEWYPDGQRLAIEDANRRSLWIGDPNEEMVPDQLPGLSGFCWSGTGNYAAGIIAAKKQIEIFDDQVMLLKQIPCDDVPSITFRPYTDQMAVRVGKTLYSCSPEGDWRLHYELDLPNIQDWERNELKWSPDGSHLYLQGGYVLRFQDNHFSIVREFVRGGTCADTWNSDGTRNVAADGLNIYLFDAFTGYLLKKHSHPSVMGRCADRHPIRPIFTMGFDDSTFAHYDEDTLQPYWRGVQLPGNQSIAITPAGQILNGDREAIDKHLVYYIETDEGLIKMLTPTEFERLIGESIYTP